VGIGPGAGLLAVAVALRRVSLPAMVLLAVVAAVTQVAGSGFNPVADVAYAPLFFTLGAHPQRRVRRFGLVAAAVAVVVAGVWLAAVISTGAGPRGSAPDAIWAVFAGVALAALTAVIVGGGWVAGFLRWQRRQTIQARSDARVDRVERRRLAQLYEQEQVRGRIAADMHDVVAHSWAVVAAQSDGARYLLETDPGQAERALAEIGRTARSAMGDVRRLVTQLREKDSDAGGGGCSVPENDSNPDKGDSRSQGTVGIERIEELIQRMRTAGMDLLVRHAGSPPGSGLSSLTAARVMTEALTNARKHGDLTEPVVMEEDWTDGFRLRVENSPAAASASSASWIDGDGHGLRGMRERVRLAGGTAHAGLEGERWVTRVTIPAGDQV
jgi:signal transduction histidine kinase